jgi:hypothetical protein
LIAQRGGVGQRLQPDRVLSQPWDGKRSRDRPERHEQVIVAKLEPLAVASEHVEGTPLEVGARDTPDEQLGVA